MSLQSDIVPYTDLDGLVSVYAMNPKVYRSTDNGPLFTATYYVLIKLLGETSFLDTIKYAGLISSCVGLDHQLHRAPNDTSQDEADDYLGVYSANLLLGVRSGFKLPLALYRYPQLVVLAALSSNRLLMRLIGHMLTPILALSILFSCFRTSSTDTGSRCLGFLQALAGAHVSILCALAAKVWFNRLSNDYVFGMKSVYSTYFGSQHPFTTYIGLLKGKYL